MTQVVSSYIRTTGSDVFRQRDVLSFPFNGRPGLMTIYLRFVELGTVLRTDAQRRLLQVGGAQAAGRLVIVRRSDATDAYQMTLNRDTANSASVALATGPSVGDIVELVGQLARGGNGLTLTLIQSINGAATTTAGPSSALVPPPTFSETTVYVGSAQSAGFDGNFGLIDLNIQRGVLSLQSMRRLAGVARA